MQSLLSYFRASEADNATESQTSGKVGATRAAVGLALALAATASCATAARPSPSASADPAIPAGCTAYQFYSGNCRVGIATPPAPLSTVPVDPCISGSCTGVDKTKNLPNPVLAALLDRMDTPHPPVPVAVIEEPTQTPEPPQPDQKLLKSVLETMPPPPSAEPEEAQSKDALDQLIGYERCRKIIGIRAKVDQDAAPFLKNLPGEYRSRSFPSFLSGSNQKDLDRNLLTAIIEINGQIIQALEKALGLKIPIHPLRLPTGPQHFKSHFVPNTRNQRLLVITGIDPAFATRLLYLALDYAEKNASCHTIIEPEEAPLPEPPPPEPENQAKTIPRDPLDMDVCPADETFMGGQCYPKDLPPLDLPPIDDRSADAWRNPL